MIEKITKQQEDMKRTMMELEDRRAERDAEQSRRELAKEDRLLDLLGSIVMRNSRMMMPMPPSQLVPPASHMPPPSSPSFNPYHGMYTGRTDREQIRSRINNNDCRTFRPRRPLSTAYKTKETAA